jgi:hypothetical protein
MESELGVLGVHSSKRKNWKKLKKSSHKLPKQQSTSFWSQGILGVNPISPELPILDQYLILKYEALLHGTMDIKSCDTLYPYRYELPLYVWMFRMIWTKQDAFIKQVLDFLYLFLKQMDFIPLWELNYIWT